MRRAVVLSAFGFGTTSPNPPVGCVILDGDEYLVGEGYHERKGGPHAETQALAAAGEHAHGGTAVVTLEPCNHYGRTPPCRQALIDAGVARVVISVIDPTSRGVGGAAALRSAGLDVEVGVLDDETRLVHDAVLSDDGRLEEGVLDGHGRDVFDLAATQSSLETSELLASLVAGGVRSLLIDGDCSLVSPFLEAGWVDQAVAYIETGGPSSAGQTRAGVNLSAGLVPGFALRDVTRVGRAVRVSSCCGAPG
ncbi:MAG: bifunctional diaminohydroxyphosphoribosylaminopyrimidine deaminase/5-amino-6-(5-phosphoribosylamino)uracil reductase RibD [Pseudonocardiaceae bacterium]